MNGSYYREKADRCRLRAAIATIPDIKNQLSLWAHEFDEIAEAADKRNRHGSGQPAGAIGGASRYAPKRHSA